MELGGHAYSTGRRAFAAIFKASDANRQGPGHCGPGNIVLGPRYRPGLLRICHPHLSAERQAHHHSLASLDVGVTLQQRGFLGVARRPLVEGTGFEPVYAKRSDLQSDGFNHSPTPPLQRRLGRKRGARARRPGGLWWSDDTVSTPHPQSPAKNRQAGEMSLFRALAGPLAVGDDAPARAHLVRMKAMDSESRASTS